MRIRANILFWSAKQSIELDELEEVDALSMLPVPEATAAAKKLQMNLLNHLAEVFVHKAFF